MEMSSCSDIVPLLLLSIIISLNCPFIWGQQKSKELGMCENEFKYRMEKRDIMYNKYAEEVRKSMK